MSEEKEIRALWFAVLLNAFNDIRKRDLGREYKKASLDAYSWITARDKTRFNSFENIVSHLGLDPGELRKAFLKVKPISKNYNWGGKKKKAHQNV